MFAVLRHAIAHGLTDLENDKTVDPREQQQRKECRLTKQTTTLAPRNDSESQRHVHAAVGARKSAAALIPHVLHAAEQAANASTTDPRSAEGLCQATCDCWRPC